MRSSIFLTLLLVVLFSSSRAPFASASDANGIAAKLQPLCMEEDEGGHLKMFCECMTTGLAENWDQLSSPTQQDLLAWKMDKDPSELAAKDTMILGELNQKCGQAMMGQFFPNE